MCALIESNAVFAGKFANPATQEVGKYLATSDYSFVLSQAPWLPLIKEIAWDYVKGK